MRPLAPMKRRRGRKPSPFVEVAMRRYEVKMTDGSTKFIPAENKRQAIDRCYLWGYKVEKIRPIFNCGGKGKWVNVLA